MEFAFAVLPLLVVVAIIAGIVVLVRRGRGQTEAAGGDYIPYLLLALAVGVAAFSLAELAQTATRSDIVFNPAAQVASALAGIVVATPVAVLLWRRQQRRRQEYPSSGGWTIYLALMEAVFLGVLVSGAAALLESAFGNADAPTWTDVLVFGGVVVLHDWASRATPPRSQAAELPRVVGSAIGMITTAVGASGVLYVIFERAYATVAPVVAGGDLWQWLSLLLVGAPVWWYRWWRPWAGDPTTPRKGWLAIVSFLGLSTLLATSVFTVIQVLAWMFTDVGSSARHFDFLPAALSVGLVATLLWLHHARHIGPARETTRQAYEYSMSALGMVGMVAAATELSRAAFATSRIFRTQAEDVITSLAILSASALIWGFFWARASRSPRDKEVTAGPRRAYLTGLGVVMGLTAAGSLIATLVVLFQQLLGARSDSSIATQASLFVFAGAAMWHLLRVNAGDRALVAAPFTVTVIGSDLGDLADALPKRARVRLIERSDGVGAVTDEMATAIAEAVGETDSLVWVDTDGFRVAPAS